MIEKLYDYKNHDVRYRFFRDDRFTICMAKSGDKMMIGTAFCTKQDEYRADVGCHVALERLCKNLHLPREGRIMVHKRLDEELAVEENFFNELITIDKKLNEMLVKRTGKTMDELFPETREA